MNKDYWQLALISGIAFGLLGMATYPYGIGIAPDSVSYFSAMKNLLEGNGLFLNIIRWNSFHNVIPLIHWPPLFPLTLAAFSLLTGLNFFQVAWLVNLSLYAFNALLVGVVVLKTTESKISASIAMGFFCLSYPVYSLHAMALSEPLFIALLMLSLICLTKYLQNNLFSWLLLASLAAGLSWLTRYAGFTIVLMGIVSLLILQKKSTLARIWSAATFGGLAVIPIACWNYRNYRLIGKAVDKWIPPQAQLLQNIGKAFLTVAAWFSSDLPTGLAALLALLILALIIWPFFNRRDLPAAKSLVCKLWGIFLGIYAAAIVLLASLFSDIPVHIRLLLPTFPAILILLFISLATLRGGIRWQIIQKISLVILGLLFGSQLLKAAVWGKETFDNGSGYTSRRWQESALLNWLNKNSLGGTLFSPANDVLVLYTTYAVRDVPIHGEEKQLDKFWATMRRYNGLIIYLDGVNRPRHLTEKELLATGKITLISSFADGHLYELKE